MGFNAVERSAVKETTALGAGYLAGMGVGFWETPDDIAALWRADRRFEPSMSDNQRALPSTPTGTGPSNGRRDGRGNDIYHVLQQKVGSSQKTRNTQVLVGGGLEASSYSGHTIVRGAIVT